MQSNIRIELGITNNKPKPSQRQLLYQVLLSLGLSLLLCINSVQAERSKITSVYLNSDSSIVLEAEATLTMSSPQLVDDTYIVAINEAKLAADIENNISTEYFDLELSETKTGDRGFWSFNNLVELRIKPKKQTKHQVTTRTILDGLAYEIQLVEQEDQWRPVLEQANQEIHQLSAKINETENHQVNETRLNKFIKDLDDELVKELDSNTNYQVTSQEKQDSAALLHLAETLLHTGKREQALKAYQEALELNPENHDAHLALAKASDDEAVKLNNYLASVADEALMAISSTWFEQGRQSHDMKTIAKGLVAYQFAVLKNPHNAGYRLSYAKALEESGPAFYDQAAKRYLEAASLAKRQYLAGADLQANILRDATESLIRIQTIRGEFLLAAQYCNSYINLGFQHFQNGKAIAAILKEIESSRNPFRDQLAYLGDIET